MSNKERGSYGNRYCTCNLRMYWLRWLHRLGGGIMIITVIETLIIMSMPFLLIGAFMEAAAELEVEA
mgnify:CR=1 FL=1